MTRKTSQSVSVNFMADFKSKYIYPIFVLRLFLLIALVGAILLFIFIGIPSLTKQHSGLKAFGLISLGFLLSRYLIIAFGKSTLTQRYSISIARGRAILHDNIFGRHINLDENFKGFSLSSYGDRRTIYKFKTLIFYFENGHKIELPQFLFANFKDIIPSLNAHSIRFLGQEPYKWKNIFSRHYFFE